MVIYNRIIVYDRIVYERQVTMKIVIDARTLGSRPSGIGIYAFNYIKELIETDNEVVLLTDVATSGEMQYLKDRKVQIITYGRVVYQSAQVFGYFGFVRKMLRQIQPELFWEPNILIPLRLTGFKGKVMITVHDMFPVMYREYFGAKYSMYFKYMFARTIKRTDIILYNSEETRRDTERYFKGAAGRRNYVLYIIVPRIAGAEDNAGRAGRDTESTGDYFLYVGNMEKRKGVDLLIEAYRQYCASGGDKKLILAGKSRENDIDEMVDRLVCECPGARYLGYVSEEQKQKLYENCACFVFPSMAEGFGICVLEAMNYYKPVIASNLSIFKEVVGDCVMYFPVDKGRKEAEQSLAGLMKTYNINVDHDEYNRYMDRYQPDKLGHRLEEIINNI